MAQVPFLDVKNAPRYILHSDKTKYRTKAISKQTQVLNVERSLRKMQYHAFHSLDHNLTS